MYNTLSRKLSIEKSTGTAPGLIISNRLEPIHHALFADDSLLLGGVSTRIAKTFKATLHGYCSVSGPLINDIKSVVYGWKADEHEIQKVAQILGFIGYERWDKIKYLGFPLTLGINMGSLWVKVISKIKAKIEFWGGQWLTNGRKITLIKSMLSALPIYQSSFLLAPKTITKQISKMLHDFLWKGGKGN